MHSEHLEGDGEAIFRHACSLGLKGIVSKRRDARYRSGRSVTWLNGVPITSGSIATSAVALVGVQSVRVVIFFEPHAEHRSLRAASGT